MSPYSTHFKISTAGFIGAQLQVVPREKFAEEGRLSPRARGSRCSCTKKEKARSHLFNETGPYFWQRPTLAQAIQALPSGLQRLTSVFGMGTGGTTALESPECEDLNAACAACELFESLGTPYITLQLSKIYRWFPEIYIQKLF